MTRRFRQMRRRAEHYLTGQTHVELPRTRYRSGHEKGGKLLQPSLGQMVAEDEQPRAGARFTLAPVDHGLDDVVGEHVAAQYPRHLLHCYFVPFKEGDEGPPDRRNTRPCIHREVDAQGITEEHEFTLKGALRMADPEDAGCMVLVRFGIGGVGGMHRASKRVMFPCRYLRAVVAEPVNDFCRAPRSLRKGASTPSVLRSTSRSASTCAASGRGAPNSAQRIETSSCPPCLPSIGVHTVLPPSCPTSPTMALQRPQSPASASTDGRPDRPAGAGCDRHAVA